MTTTFACPKCYLPLDNKTDPNFLICHQDSVKYPIKDGLPILIINKSLPI